MKQKLFTILTLLLCICSGAWATDIVPSFVAGNTANQAVKTTIEGFGDLYFASRSTTTTNTPSNHTNYRAPKGNFVFELSSASTIDITFYSTSARTVKVGLYTVDETTFQVWQAASTADPAVTMDAWLVAHKNDLAADGETTLDAYYIAKGFKTSSNHLASGSDNQKALMPEATSSAEGLTTAGQNIYTKVYYPTDATTITQNAQTVIHVNNGSTIPAGKYLMTIGDSGSNMGIEKITITSAVPTLTGAWKVGGETVTSGTIYQGDAVPSLSLSVGATDSSTPAAEKYNVAYSKTGDDVVEITGGGSGFTLKNNVTGTATLKATITATGTDYLDAAATVDYVYTVNAKSPALNLSKDEVTLKSTPVTRNGQTTVSLTGAYLEGTTGTVSVDAVSGLSISPTSFTITDGTVAETEFTITYNSDSGASGDANITFSDGNINKVLIVHYNSVLTHEWATVSAATTWDWTKLTKNVQLTASTTPTKAEEFLLGDMNGEVLTQDVGYDLTTFNADALKLIAEYPCRDTKYTQATQIKFKTSVPGTVKVNYSNTGGSRPYRHIEVNGVLSAEGSASSTAKDTEEIPVSAGEVTIKVYIPNATSPQSGNNDVVGYTMARIYKIIFTPLSGDNKDVISVSDVNYATYVTTADIDFSKTDGVKAYKVKSVNPISYEEVTEALTGTPLLIAAESSSYILQVADDTPAEITDNLLQASTGSNITGDGATIYVLGKKDNKAVWGKLVSGKTLSAGKAALTITGGLAREYYDIMIGGETTGVESLNIDNSPLTIDAPMYNLAGQRVNKSYKGVVIVNGKKMLNK